MGHGTKHLANATYKKLDLLFKYNGYNNYFIGTVEDEPTLDNILSGVEALGVSKVLLVPLMVVAGDHAVNDMAGDGEDSWKNFFRSKGYEVECVLKGLGEYKGVQDMFVERIDKYVE